MKNLIISLAAVLVLFGAVAGWNVNRQSAAAATPAPTPDAVVQSAAAETPAATQAPIEVKGLDYAAIRALYPEDQTAITVEDETLDWGFFADFLRTNGLQYEDYFKQMAAYYGVAASWTGSVGDGTGHSYAEDLLEETKATLSSFMAIHAYAKEKGVSLDENAQKTLEPEQMAVDICGEGATVEDFSKLLEENSHMSIDAFRYYSESVALYSAIYAELYGEKGEKLTDEQVIDALEADGYLSAAHILFMTIDPMTGKELDKDEVAKKLEKAEALVKELRAIEDPEQLQKRFAELKEEYCEDTGKTTYPDGYTFTPGTMVAQFEDTIKAQKDYEISDPVKTSYGYHIIMRLPLKADSLLTSNTSEPVNARASVAQSDITKQLDAWFEAHPPVYAEGLETLDLTKYIEE